ncbi:hypothetical protein [Marinomonas flavescens]|uniref:hypothetical protein n=1 Tax=Marinomonas flavescens TaxID=2529379 RepID=UPI001A9D84E4|nr:hypothetical protein [Marinomonas flavescens]
MKSEFEIKYIEIQWYDQETVIKITESLFCLSLEYNKDIECFECETTIYPNTGGLRGQLAVRFLHNNIVNPYIQLPNGGTQYLSSIDDIDTGKTWWVVKDKWDNKNQYWQHSSINTAGTLRLILQDKVCQILIGSIDFTREQLDTYLSSFKDDLWELILDDSSPIQADKEGNSIGINEEVIECIQHLIVNADKILNAPKSELREIQTLKSRKSVKPVNRTFMELVSKRNQNFLTSRATKPSYNVAENRYVLFALERSYRIIKKIAILSRNKVKRYANTVDRLQSQYDAFTDIISIDRELVVKDLKILGERCHLDYWQRKLKEQLNKNGINLDVEATNHNELYIRTQNYTKDQISGNKDGFFIEIFNNGVWGKVDNKTTILSFKYNYSNLIRCLKTNSEYRVIGAIHRNKSTNSVLYSISSLSLVELLTTKGFQVARKKFEEEKQLGLQLNSNGWKRNLRSNELEEQEKEKNALVNRINFYADNEKLSAYVYDKVAPKLKQLTKIIKSLRRLEIKHSSNFPNSMTFVQNPNYQGVHNNYKVLRKVTNLADDELLIRLEEIDAIGLVNMPIIYERWCLLQIIKVLRESFRYVLEDNWKYKLIEAIRTNTVDIEIKLSNLEAKRFITLTYEMTLDNGKRPDFVLDVEWWPEDKAQNIQKKRFVMDAKFYNQATFTRFGGLIGAIDLLYTKKNYSEDNKNPVFILHPCKEAISERVTAQEWGKYSFLGELAINENYSNPLHQYGGVFLSPIDRLLYLDELQRVLGLFLQYKLEDPDTSHNSRNDDRTASKPFCIRCGSCNLRQIEKSSGYYNKDGEWVPRTPRSVWMQCNECEQFISFNHCRSTDTRIIKNGFYWTYHSARAIEPFNNKCPSCGEWGAW